jgi:gephyrin
LVLRGIREYTVFFYCVIRCHTTATGANAAFSPQDLESSLRMALRSCDTLITTGGASMGELDLLKPTIERALGGVIHFGRVAMKPGKPTTFASVQVKDNNGTPTTKLIFSLPGNPASAVVCTALFVLPSLRLQGGELAAIRDDPKRWLEAGLTRTKVELVGPVRCDKSREEYHRVHVSFQDGRLVAATTGMQRSSRVGSFRSANALLVLPAGGGTKGKGEVVEALLLGDSVGT